MTPAEIAAELRKMPDLLRLPPDLLARDITVKYQVSNSTAHRAIYHALFPSEGR